MQPVCTKRAERMIGTSTSLKTGTSGAFFDVPAALPIQFVLSQLVGSSVNQSICSVVKLFNQLVSQSISQLVTQSLRKLVS